MFNLILVAQIVIFQQLQPLTLFFCFYPSADVKRLRYPGCGSETWCDRTCFGAMSARSYAADEGGWYHDPSTALRRNGGSDDRAFSLRMWLRPLIDTGMHMP